MFVQPSRGAHQLSCTCRRISLLGSASCTPEPCPGGGRSGGNHQEPGDGSRRHGDDRPPGGPVFKRLGVLEADSPVEVGYREPGEVGYPGSAGGCGRSVPAHDDDLPFRRNSRLHPRLGVLEHNAALGGHAHQGGSPQVSLRRGLASLDVSSVTPPCDNLLSLEARHALPWVARGRVPPGADRRSKSVSPLDFTTARARRRYFVHQEVGRWVQQRYIRRRHVTPTEPRPGGWVRQPGVTRSLGATGSVARARCRSGSYGPVRGVTGG